MSTFEKTFSNGDIIIREGDSGNTFFQLLEGNVAVYKNYGEGDEVQVAVIEPGQYFGEMAVIETYPRSSTVVATGDVKVVEIPAEALNEYFTQNPDKILAIMEVFGSRIKKMTDDCNEAKKYFIKFTDRYDKSDYFEFEDDVNNDDVEELSVIKGNAGMGNKLAVDIMNGEGPDILMNVSQFGQLNNSNYLVDLSPFVKDRDMYFSNIIDGSRIDGALYQVPVSFSLEGIIVRKKDIGSSGKGFTLDEYREFISKGANGKDPILFGQATYFAMLFNSMSDKFIANGKVDLSAPEFAQLADYVKDNVREKGTTYNVEFDGLDPMAEYVKHCRGFGEFFQLMRTATSGQNGETLAGIPSCDGRGPRFSTECSVAVSAQALDINACGEFVKILLSEDIQTEIAKNDLFVINRNAFKKAAAAGVEYYNGGGQWFGGGKGISPSGLHIKLKEKDNFSL